MKAMRNDDFNTILELKMRGYQPSENTLKSLQPDISSTTFIAAVRNLPNGRGTKKPSGHKVCAKPDYKR